MSVLWRRLTIRSFLPFTFKFFRNRSAKVLQRFSVTELDSAWQSLYALNYISDPKLRLKLFNHALEETLHSEEFDRVSRPYSDLPPPRPTPERRPIFSPAEGLPAFIAYVYVGEKDVLDQFGSYSAAVGKNAVQDVFLEAEQDEEGHASLTMNYLVESLGSRRAARCLIWKARLKRIYEAWLRLGRNMGDFMAGAFLSLIFYACGPLFTLACRKYLVEGWTHENIRCRTDEGLALMKTLKPL